MKANESHKHYQKRLHFFRAAYLAVKSYSFSCNERNTGQFICWFTDNFTAKRMQKTFYRGLMHSINHHSKMDTNSIVNRKIGKSLVVCL